MGSKGGAKTVQRRRIHAFVVLGERMMGTVDWFSASPIKFRVLIGWTNRLM